MTIQSGHIEFQFPSNGKVEPKERENAGPSVASIYQFQFPSNGKVEPKKERCTDNNHAQNILSFNSLQTGKWSQRLRLRKRTQGTSECFNSLQTGKWSQRKSSQHRNSASVMKQFQFPSNGKVEPKIHKHTHKGELMEVSIPFKRESGAKVKIQETRNKWVASFNSLQTGKWSQSRE